MKLIDTQMCAFLPLEGENLFYVRLEFNSDLKRRALIDTSSCSNALQESFSRTTNKHAKPDCHGRTFFHFGTDGIRPESNYQKTSENIQNWNTHIQDSFLILPTMKCAILGNPFFKKHNIKIDPCHNLLDLPDSTVQLNQILPEQGQKPKYTKKLPKIPLVLTKKVYILPQALSECRFDNFGSYK